MDTLDPLEPDFELEILQPNGQPYNPRRLFNDSSLEGVGVVDGIDSAVGRGYICKAVNFSGRADLVRCPGADIVKFRVKVGGTWRDAGYGTILDGWAERTLEDGGNLVRAYTAEPEELLRASVVTGTESYAPGRDVGSIARDLSLKYHHPALTHADAAFTETGVVLDSPSTFTGMTLLEAFEQLASRAEGVNGRTLVYGVSPAGYVVFDYPNGTVTLPYDPAEYRDLKVDARGLCTAVLWVVGNTPSDPLLKVFSDIGLLWGEETHLSVPDSVLHSKYNRLKALQVKDPRSVYSAAAATLSVGNDFSITSGVAKKSGVPTNNNEAIINIDPPDLVGAGVRGARITYRRDYDVENAELVLFPTFEHRSSGFMFTSGAIYFSLELPYTGTQYNTVEALIPDIIPFAYAHTVSGVTTNYMMETIKNLQLSVRSRGSGLNLYVNQASARYFKLNTVMLDRAARRELKTPALEPVQLTPTTIQNGERRGVFVLARDKVTLTGAPAGSVTGEIAEVRYSYNAKEKFACVVDLGNPNREGDELVERIALGVDRRISRSEIQQGRRVG